VTPELLFERIREGTLREAAVRALLGMIAGGDPRIEPYFERHDAACHAALAAALADPGTVSRQPLDCLAAAQLRARHGLADPELQLSPRLLDALAGDPLCLALLGETINTDLVLERVFSRARQALVALHPGSPERLDELMPLLAALARQCFANEDLFDTTASEEQRLAGIEQEIARAADAKQTAPLGRLLMLRGLYHPPSELDSAAAIAALPLHELSVQVHAAIRQMLLEPLAEVALRGSLSRLDPVHEPTSERVRDQYEQNPYPRWLHLPEAGSPLPGNAGEPRQLLVAGCGTGQHPLRLALANPADQILGLDLSVASLTYGMRMASKLGIDNVTFVQGDLLELSRLGRRFDHIECVGVLQHIRDHRRAWEALAHQLRPGGTMVVGVYSKYARLLVADLRAQIAREEISPTPEGMRSFRRRLLDDPANASTVSSLERVHDFFTMSMLRDLLFHAYEHTYTVAEIEEIVNQLGLSLLEVRVDHIIPEAVRERILGRTSVDTFDDWRRLELAYVGSFGLLICALQKPIE
jgi:2-polyprenyl-3-methyl-5-hydroxy-6-metoxy-1,4-benzoquinol methylase